MNKYFSENYFQAREKFRKNTSKLKISNHHIIDDLTIDVAESHPRKKEKLLIIISGTHGVEGYVGSAFQLFFIDKYLSKIKNKYGILLIHALNPYGFKNNRRYNENNVDLNRNNNKDFSKINSFFNKNKLFKEENIFNIKRAFLSDNFERIRYNLLLYKLILKHGISKTIQLIGHGQNKYPKGLCYSGKNKEKSILFLDKKIKEITKDYKETILIDVHTGAAKKYNLDIFTANKINEVKIKGSFKSTNTKKKGTDHIGGIENSLFENSKSKKNIHFTLEYGTINKYSTVISLNYLSYLLFKENQITNFGPFEKIPKIRQKMKKAYFPEEKKFKENMLKKTKEFLDKITNYQ